MPSATCDRAAHKAFWQEQATRLGSFRDAPSTDYYLEGELRIIGRHVRPLAGTRLLKLDLWNEVRNTNVLAELARRGAETFAVDLARPLVLRAAGQFRDAGLAPRFVVADVRELPFAGGSFDAVYTMGTIEHVPEMQACVDEIFRVTRPGGVAIVGVPNRHDPFLRPALVAALDRCGLYPYGLEQSLTHRDLAQLLARSGFEIVGTEGLLFMPGLLRMAELALLEPLPTISRLLGELHRPFRAACRRWPGLNRHGYLIAAVGRRPT